MRQPSRVSRVLVYSDKGGSMSTVTTVHSGAESVRQLRAAAWLARRLIAARSALTVWLQHHAGKASRALYLTLVSQIRWLPRESSGLCLSHASSLVMSYTTAGWGLKAPIGPASTARLEMAARCYRCTLGWCGDTCGARGGREHRLHNHSRAIWPVSCSS